MRVATSALSGFFEKLCLNWKGNLYKQTSSFEAADRHLSMCLTITKQAKKFSFVLEVFGKFRKTFKFYMQKDGV